MDEQRTALDTAKDLKKKAIRLHQTYKLIWPLIDLNSPMEKKYWQSYNCCREVVQEGVYLRFKYCNCRWCFECNAIRAAKMINGYESIFREFKLPQFVTLTRPNVSADKLESEITNLIKTFQKLVHNLRGHKGINIKGIRKLEVTYNWAEQTYHPHFHLIVDSPGSAHAIMDEWLFRNPEASPAAQNIKLIDKLNFEGSLKELFKYATKICVDDEMSLYAKDFIFQCLLKKRIFQPFGIDRKVSEDVEELVTQGYACLDPETYEKWYFNQTKEDWNTLRGESLIQKITDSIMMNSGGTTEVLANLDSS